MLEMKNARRVLKIQSSIHSDNLNGMIDTPCSLAVTTLSDTLITGVISIGIVNSIRNILLKQ